MSKRTKTRPVRRERIGRLLDSMIAPVAPAYAYRRSRARHMRAALDRRSAQFYDGAVNDRQHSDWKPTGGSADAITVPDLPTLINRSRDVMRNTSVGASILRALVRNSVGAAGLRPKPIVIGELDFNREAALLFEDWANDPRECDVERKSDFWTIQKTAIRQAAEAGEQFIVESTPAEWQTIPLRLQLIDVENLDTDMRENPDTGNEVRRGIELDAGRAPVAYYFKTRASNDLGVSRRQGTTRVPADRVHHVMRAERGGQSHGVPWLAPVLRNVRDLDEWSEWELQAARVQACIAILRERGEQSIDDVGLEDSGDTGEDRDVHGNVQNVISPGLIFDGAPGDKLEAFQASRPQGTFAPYFQAQLRMISSAFGLDYEVVARDFTGGNFSSLRQGLLEADKEYAEFRAMMVRTLTTPVWKRAITLAVFAGKLTAPQFIADPVPWLRVEWHAKPSGWIDPLKQEKAHDTALKNGSRTWGDVARERGITLDEHVANIAAEIAIARKNGIRHPMDAGQSAAEPEPDDPLLLEDADADEEDAKENGNGSNGRGRVLDERLTASRFSHV